MNGVRGERPIAGTDFILVPAYNHIAQFESVSGVGIFEFAAKVVYRQATFTELVRFVWAFSGVNMKEAEVGSVLVKRGINNILPDITDFLQSILKSDDEDALTDDDDSIKNV